MSSGGSVRHPLFARVYASIAGRGEEAGQAEHRQELLPGMRGRVVEVGAGGWSRSAPAGGRGRPGDGLNSGHYPDSVEEVIALEPEPYLRERAERAAARAPVAVSVRGAWPKRCRSTTAA